MCRVALKALVALRTVWYNSGGSVTARYGPVRGTGGRGRGRVRVEIACRSCSEGRLDVVVAFLTGACECWG